MLSNVLADSNTLSCQQLYIVLESSSSCLQSVNVYINFLFERVVFIDCKYFEVMLSINIFNSDIVYVYEYSFIVILLTEVCILSFLSALSSFSNSVITNISLSIKKRSFCDTI